MHLKEEEGVNIMGENEITNREIDLKLKGYMKHIQEKISSEEIQHEIIYLLDYYVSKKGIESARNALPNLLNKYK